MIHSLVIGLTLAITSGSDFTSLLVAVTFHQLFEGLSLGIRIASLPAPKGRVPWLRAVLAVLFAITVPVGISIGLLAFSASSAAGGASLFSCPSRLSVTGKADAATLQTT
jgi:zinc transporter 1/2/3